MARKKKKAGWGLRWYVFTASLRGGFKFLFTGDGDLLILEKRSKKKVKKQKLVSKPRPKKKAH